MAIYNGVKKAKAFRSLTSTLTVAFLLMSLLILLIVTALGTYFNFQGQQKLIVSQQNLIAQRAADTVKNFIQEKFRLLNMTVNFNNLITVSKEEQNLALAKSLGLEPSFRQLILLNVLGQELTRISRSSEIASEQINAQLKINDILVQIKENKEYFSPIYIYETTSEPMAIMAIPVKSIF